jgi:NAD(P)-dependent dehydrogenase (short-subunit alcohol dehydrogenase family)
MHVVLGSRDASLGEKAALTLRAGAWMLYVTSWTSPTKRASMKMAEWLGTTFGRLDVLVNKAGIMPNKMPFREATLREAETTWQVNVVGA